MMRKYRIFLIHITVFIQFCLIPGATVLKAQTTQSWRSASVLVHVSAIVMQPNIRMEMLNEMDVGQVQPSQKHVFLNPGADPGAALVKLTGRPQASVQIQFSEHTSISNSTDTELVINYLVNGSKRHDQITSRQLHMNPMTVQLNEAGEFFLWVGCRFNLLKASTGQYNGEFILEVEYN